MKKRRKREAKKPRLNTDKKNPLGFDFGCLPHGAALGSLSFPDHLRAAEIVAVAYGTAYSEDLDQYVPEISLVGLNRDPLQLAHSEFSAWAEASDGDAVEVTIVFLEAGGYLIGLSPEVSRLLQRCAGYDTTHRFLTFAMTWVKPIDTVHPALRQIRTYASQFPAPWLFSLAHLPPYTSSPDVDSVVPIEGKAFLKFDITLVDESEVAENTSASAIVATHRSKVSRSKAKPNPVDPKSISEFRDRMLRTHFPITLERVWNNPEIISMRTTLVDEGLKPWQVDQAVCNATLSRALVGAPHYSGMSRRLLDTKLPIALGERFEQGGIGGLPSVSSIELRNQVLADARYLLRLAKQKAPNSLGDAQSALLKAGFLESPE